LAYTGTFKIKDKISTVFKVSQAQRIGSSSKGKLILIGEFVIGLLLETSMSSIVAGFI